MSMSMSMSLSSSSWCTAAAADLQSSIVRRSRGGVVGTAGAVSSPGRLQLHCFSSSRCSTYGYGNMKFSDNTMIRIIRRRPKKTITSISCFSALNPELKSTLDKVVTSHKVILFMKGTKEFPQCGFSNTVVQILKSLNVPFETVNILENEVLRQGLKEYSNWPTFPQLYIEGEFFGGCDITVDAYKTGELHEQLEKAMCS